MEPIHWHNRDCEWVLKNLETDSNKGLSESEVFKRQNLYGKNEISQKPIRPLYLVFFNQFASPLIYLLLFAALAAFLLGEGKDSIVIFIVVLLNSIIGTFQEGRAERSLAALKKLTQVFTKVIRDGNEKIFPSTELVPGDIILLYSGDYIPADSRIIESYSFEVSEAALTGESLPINKSSEKIPEKTILADRTNMIYAGTFTNSGRAKAVVVKTGLETEIGQIAKLAESTKEAPTPLEKRISEFSKFLLKCAFVLFILIMGIGLLNKVPMVEIILVAISQVVSMVPEGLPVAMTVALAVGVQRMAKKKTIVRKLSAVETLGSTTVICSDKTGTLTKNEMTVTRATLANGEKFNVTGVGYGPEGYIQKDAKKIIPQNQDDLYQLLKVAILCNDCHLELKENLWTVVGDPTEAALITLASKGGIFKNILDKENPRIAEIPFSPLSKAMVTEHQNGGGRKFLAIKGALESILPMCSKILDKGAILDLKDREKIKIWANEMASSALRVLAFAYIPDESIKSDDISTIKNAIFLGIIGQMDPPRMEVAAAIKKCKKAGIRPIMITGDHKLTGLEIAKSIGMAEKDDVALDGEELENLPKEEMEKKLGHVSVFARIHPSQKLKIVEALQKNHQVVAMTGDGVNDAPALTKADVGVAMGISGTEVAKEASKIVITDDNFSTIVSAVEEGRLVYQNIKKVILLLFPTSLAEILVLFLGLLLGFPPLFAAVQILWNNLVTEGIITISLIMDPLQGDELKKPPISPHEPLVTKPMLKRIILIATTISAVAFGWFFFRIKSGISFEEARTETFCLLVICEWFNLVNCRSDRVSGLNLDIFKNKWIIISLLVGNILQVAVIYWRPLGDLFYTVPMDLGLIPLLGLVGSLVFWVEELRKYWVRSRINVMH